MWLSHTKLNYGKFDTLLKHNPEDDDDDVDDPEEQNWQKALAEGRKEFVSHPFYQQFFRKQLDGEYGYKHRTNPLRWNLINVPFALVLFCAFPFIVFFRSLPRSKHTFCHCRNHEGEREAEKKETV